jgi:imidazole glycerol phosphate synthase subunit HisF
MTPQPIRIMPCLDTQNGRVVKGVHFVDTRALKAYLRSRGVHVP